MPNIDKKYYGHIAILTANVCWGLMAPFSKDFLNHEFISPWALSGVRIIGGALLFWLISLAMPASIRKEKIEKKDVLRLIIASVLVIAANQSLVTIGMSYTSPAEATIMCSMTPVFTLIYTVVLLRKRVHIIRFLGVGIGMFGVLSFIFTSQPMPEIHVPNPLLGNILCLAAQMCGGLYLVFFGEMMCRYSAFTMMKWMFSISAVILFPFTISEIVSAPWISIESGVVIDLLYIVLIGTCLCYLLLPIAQRTVASTTIAMYNYLQPIVGVMISVILGLAVMDITAVFYMLLVFFGVWLVSRNQKKKA